MDKKLYLSRQRFSISKSVYSEGARAYAGIKKSGPYSVVRHPSYFKLGVVFMEPNFSRNSSSIKVLT